MIDPTSFVLLLNELSTTLTLVLMLGLCLVSIGILGRCFGAYGLVSYYVIGTIIGNLQVLKGTQFFFFSEPIALGTTVYASLFLCNTLLTQIHSKELTKKSIYLSSLTFVIFTGFMLLTVGYQPLDASYGFLHEAHTAMATLFIPMPGLIVASVLSFIISERSTTIMFLLLKKVLRNIPLSCISFLSMGFGQVLDTCIFSVLAWKVFSPVTHSWHTIFYTYIIGILIFRFALSGVFALVFPVLHRVLMPPQKKESA